MRDDGPVIRAQFWTADKIAVIIVFMAGLLIGGLVTHEYIEPALSSRHSADFNSLSALNERLDLRSDRLYSCLIENNIPLESCGL